jgi:hypothetical protein
MTFPSWARHAPDRLVLATNESGAYQIHAWDRARGTRRRVTDHPIGALHGLPSLDGEAVIWFHDETGSEVGQWLVEPFHGDPRERRRLVDGVPEAWSAGLALGDDLIVVGDCGDLPRVGAVLERQAELFGRLPIVNIDHHVSNTGFGVIDWIDPAAAATCRATSTRPPIRSAAARAWAAPAMPSATPPAACLCAGPSILTTTGPPSRAKAAARPRSRRR